MNNLKKLEEIAIDSNYSSLKSTHSNKTPTLTIGLKAFCERARSLRPPAPIAVEVISTKVKDITAKLLTEYESNSTIISVNKATNLKTHLFSATRSFKWLKRNECVSK